MIHCLDKTLLVAFSAMRSQKPLCGLKSTFFYWKMGNTLLTLRGRLKFSCGHPVSVLDFKQMDDGQDSYWIDPGPVSDPAGQQGISGICATVG